MSNPGKVVTRVLQLSRFCAARNKNKLCSAFGLHLNYHTSTFQLQNSFNTCDRFAKNFPTYSGVRTMAGLSPIDPSSFSRPEIAVIRHVSLALNVDFEAKVLSGSTMLTLEALQDVDQVVVGEWVPQDGYRSRGRLRKRWRDDLSSFQRNWSNVALDREKWKEFREAFVQQWDLILDSSDLTIQSVQLDNGTKLEYTLDATLPNFGSKLTINLPHVVTPAEKFHIKINYKTSANASALQWLEPSQTSGKTHPYLFSQCQPIHARSILPCQDTPSVKFTYDAKVTAPAEFTVLMSALRTEGEGNVTTFHQPIPIPSYLLAIAVGVLEHRVLGPRSVVWTEKEEIERAAWEFYDTEKYLQAAERLCGSYVWNQYDLLVLPPSFPYGGMENPCLTFVTPTLLAGDRSQADVIVHEIMHSWTGNLVTNKNFEHFWLNEGFTVFLERKVGASLISDPNESKKTRDFESLLGLQELSEAVNGQFTPNNPLTRLVPDLKGVHPDDAFSRVPYEKGSLFLRYLEDLVGGAEVFDGFLHAYLSRFQKKSLDTDQFKNYLLDYFKGSPNYEKLQAVDWQTWLYSPGMPPIIPDYDSSMTKAITSLLAKINEQGFVPSPEDVKNFSPHQMIHLLQELIDRQPLEVDTLEELGTAYNISNSKNSEIQYRWLRLCVRSRNADRVDDALHFVNSQGRMKYVRPLYRDLYAWPEMRQKAIDNFLKNEPFMMHVSAYTVRKDLHLNE